MTPKLTPEQKAANKAARKAKTLAKKAGKEVTPPQQQQAATPPQIALLPPISSAEDKPRIYHILHELLLSMNEPQLEIFKRRCVSMAQLTIGEYQKYPEEIIISPELTVTKYDFFETAVHVNSYLSPSPLNKA